MAADRTARKQAGRPFQPGKSGNPAGRPKGSRNKLSESFFAELLADWETHGATVIAEVRTKAPTVYLKVVASILPKEIDVRNSPFEHLSDAELDERIELLDAAIRADQKMPDDDASVH